MRKLIWVIADSTSLIVGFVMGWLKISQLNRAEKPENTECRNFPRNYLLYIDSELVQ